MRPILFTISAWLASCSLLFAQGGLIQLSGMVTGKDHGEPLPYAHVLNPAKNIGVVSDPSGFFTLVASAGDTILITSMGYKDFTYVVTETSRRLMAELEVDVKQLPETTVMPLPRTGLLLKEDFRQREIVTASTLLYKRMELAGFKRPPTHPTPPPPSIMNPISFIYDRVMKKIQEKRPKGLPALELPDWSPLDGAE